MLFEDFIYIDLPYLPPRRLAPLEQVHANIQADIEKVRAEYDAGFVERTGGEILEVPTGKIVREKA